MTSLRRPNQPVCSIIKAFSSILVAIAIFCAYPALSFAECQITLRWDLDQDTEIAGYSLYQRQQETSYNYAQQAWKGSGTQCTISGLKENTTYFFVVRAFDQNGNESGDSNEVQYRYDTDPLNQPVAQEPANQSQIVAMEPDLIAPAFADSNPTEIHSASHWQVFRNKDDTGVCVFSLDSTKFLELLTLPPCILDESTQYFWTVKYRNQNGGISEPSPASSFTTEAWEADTDKNGIADNQEIQSFSDLDHNERADAEQPELKCIKTAEGSQQAGLSIADSFAVTRIEQIQAIESGTVTRPNDTSVILPAGLIAFKLSLDQAGAETTIQLYYSEEIPDSEQWLMFSLRDDYQSIPEYSTISSDRRSIALRLQDGGIGDMDGTANGYISTMGGYGQFSAQSANLNGSGHSNFSGGGGCFIDSLF